MMASKTWTIVGLLALCAIAQAQAPAISPGGFVNSASFVGSGAIARGELVTIFGTNLSNSTVFIPLGSPNPTQIPSSTTRVYFDNIPAPLLYVSPTLHNVQVPFELPQD